MDATTTACGPQPNRERRDTDRRQRVCALTNRAVPASAIVSYDPMSRDRGARRRMIIEPPCDGVESILLAWIHDWLVLHAEGETRAATAGDTGLREREGVIWVPRASHEPSGRISQSVPAP